MPRPTLEELSLFAAKIGLPESEAERAYYYWESQGWKVGKNPMVNWKSALQYWKRTFMARFQHKAATAEPDWAREKRLKAELETLRAKLFRVGDVSPIHSHEEAAKIRAAREPIVQQIKSIKIQLGLL